MTVIVESNGISIIAVDPGCGNYRSSKITANIFGDCFRITEIGFGVDIEAVFMLAVAFCLHLFERRSDLVFKFIEKSSLESMTEIVVVKMFYMTPETIITVTAFGKKAVDVRVPFKIPAECMEDHDIAGSVIFGMVQVEKHAGYHTGNGVKEAAQEGTVLKEKVTEIFIDGKNAMTVLDINQFKRHTGRVLHGIFIPAGSTKAAVTAERDKFKVPTVRAVVHRPARRGVTAA